MFELLESGEQRQLCYELKEGDQIDLLALEMQENNQIAGLVKLKEYEPEKCLIFDVSGLTSLNDLFSRSKFSREGTINFLESMAETIQVIGDYLIPEDLVVFDFEGLFFDFSANRAVVLCLPVWREHMTGDFHSFCSEFLKGDYFNTSEDRSYLFKLRDSSSRKGFDSNVLIETLRTIRQELADTGGFLWNKRDGVESKPKKVEERRQPDFAEVNAAGMPQLLKRDSSSYEAPQKLRREDRKCNGDHPQRLLREADRAGREFVGTGCLIRKKTMEKIPITKAVFQIGSRYDTVDYCVPNNPVLSRNHAAVIFENGRYYIVDNGSSNGSFVNQVRIDRGQKVALHHNDCIILANEEFRFCCE